MIAGRYVLEREIGRGASGAVWAATDELLGRTVALKRIGLLPGADDTDLARAEREARLSARLHHPHVVGVFDVVTDETSGARWLVMEHVQGSDLGQVVRERGPLPPDAAAGLVTQVVAALVAAHGVGMVHRDVKPSNVMVDPEGRAKLTDFGIARLTSDPSLTQTGMVTGSPTYLAPEIASGSRGDEAADVWSLGATLFHLLAGRPPYQTGDVLSTLYQVVNAPPPRLGPDVAGWLAPLLEGALVKDPARRWSMAEVADFLRDRRVPAWWTPGAVETSEADTSTAAVTAGAAAPGPRRRRRDPVVMGLLGAVVLVLSLITFVVGRELASDEGAPTAADPTPAASPTPTPTPTPSESPTEEAPTAAGMEAFIEGYVSAVGEDPAVSWRQLTPEFQAASGGFETYRNFWADAENGRVDSFVSVDPETLEIAYQVTYDNFPNGPGPTVLRLSYDDGDYLIAGESSEGFVPAG